MDGGVRQGENKERGREPALYGNKSRPVGIKVENTVVTVQGIALLF